jgi:hypothetical protein
VAVAGGAGIRRGADVATRGRLKGWKVGRLKGGMPSPLSAGDEPRSGDIYVAQRREPWVLSVKRDQPRSGGISQVPKPVSFFAEHSVFSLNTACFR